MGKLQDLSSVLTGLYDQPLLGPKPDQLLIFKRPQLALKLQGLLQPATSAATKHSNLSVVNQAIAAMYEHPALHDHVAGWAPVRSGQHNAEVHLSFKDTSAQHRQQLASAGTIQLTMHGAAALEEAEALLQCQPLLRADYAWLGWICHVHGCWHADRFH